MLERLAVQEDRSAAWTLPVFFLGLEDQWGVPASAEREGSGEPYRSGADDHDRKLRIGHASDLRRVTNNTEINPRGEGWCATNDGQPSDRSVTIERELVLAARTCRRSCSCTSGLGSLGLGATSRGGLPTPRNPTTFVYSRAGYGYSSLGSLPRPITYMHEEALEVLPDLLRDAGIERPVLIGHSDGGSIAIITAGAGLPVNRSC